jgi:AMME syndrome candidate gene 1 protein
VTWNTLSPTTGHKSLRGCIGTFDAVPLPSGLQTYSLTSAFEDTRFSPIPHTLLPSLSCSLTLLANFETCATPLDWSVGIHGLRISFVHRGKRYGATYLPDVAVEQGWTQEDTLESLMKKSGWDGGGSAVGGVARRFLRGGRERTERLDGSSRPGRPWEEVSNFTTIRYTGLKASATYSEWREWRRWVEENHAKALR